MTKQDTEEESHAAVDAAENWGTYVTVQAYTDAAVTQASTAGVKCIEHGQLVKKDETAELMIENKVWWSLRPFIDDDNQIEYDAPINQEKQKLLFAGTDKAYELAIKHGVRIAWGTDVLFSAQQADKQGAMLHRAGHRSPAGPDGVVLRGERGPHVGVRRGDDAAQDRGFAHPGSR